MEWNGTIARKGKDGTISRTALFEGRARGNPRMRKGKGGANWSINTVAGGGVIRVTT